MPRLHRKIVNLVTCIYIATGIQQTLLNPQKIQLASYNNYVDIAMGSLYALEIFSGIRRFLY